jgi:hypothetical protein
MEPPGIPGRFNFVWIEEGVRAVSGVQTGSHGENTLIVASPAAWQRLALGIGLAAFGTRVGDTPHHMLSLQVGVSDDRIIGPIDGSTR